MTVTASSAAKAGAQARYDVGGVLLERPFKIRRLGHFGFNFTRLDEALRFYTELLGFVVSDDLDFRHVLPAGADRGRAAQHRATSRATAPTTTPSSCSRASKWNA